jgi:hypothetical protein
MVLNYTLDLWLILLFNLAPVLCGINYFFLKHAKYLTVDNGIIKMNNLFGKQVHLSEINPIEKYAGN